MIRVRSPGRAGHCGPVIALNCRFADARCLWGVHRSGHIWRPADARDPVRGSFWRGSRAPLAAAQAIHVEELVAPLLAHHPVHLAQVVAHELGRVPRRGEAVQVGGLVFSVMLTRGGAVRWFKVTRAADADGA